MWWPHRRVVIVALGLRTTCGHRDAFRPLSFCGAARAWASPLPFGDCAGRQYPNSSTATSCTAAGAIMPMPLAVADLCRSAWHSVDWWRSRGVHFARKLQQTLVEGYRTLANRWAPQNCKVPKNLSAGDSTRGRRLVMLVQLPPPVHGSAAMNELAIEALQSVAHFEIHTIDLSPPQSIENVGQFAFAKIFHAICVWGTLINRIMRLRPRIAYLALTPSGYAFYRDLVTISILKFFGLKLIYHLHSQGIRSSIDKHSWQHILYSFAFRNSEIIVLSQRLVEDIRPVLMNERIDILPNGIKDPAPEASLGNRSQSGYCNQASRYCYSSVICLKTRDRWFCLTPHGS